MKPSRIRENRKSIFIINHMIEKSFRTYMHEINEAHKLLEKETEEND